MNLKVLYMDDDSKKHSNQQISPVTVEAEYARKVHINSEPAQKVETVVNAPSSDVIAKPPSRHTATISNTSSVQQASKFLTSADKKGVAEKSMGKVSSKAKDVTQVMHGLFSSKKIGHKTAFPPIPAHVPGKNRGPSRGM